MKCLLGPSSNTLPNLTHSLICLFHQLPNSFSAHPNTNCTCLNCNSLHLVFLATLHLLRIRPLIFTLSHQICVSSHHGPKPAASYASLVKMVPCRLSSSDWRFKYTWVIFVNTCPGPHSTNTEIFSSLDKDSSVSCQRTGLIICSERLFRISSTDL